MSTHDEETARLQALAYRVSWIEEHETLSASQQIWLLALQMVFLSYGVMTIVSSAVIWYLDDLAAVFANIQLFVHLTVGTLLVLSVVIWVGISLARLTT